MLMQIMTDSASQNNVIYSLQLKSLSPKASAVAILHNLKQQSGTKISLEAVFLSDRPYTLHRKLNLCYLYAQSFHPPRHEAGYSR